MSFQRCLSARKLKIDPLSDNCAAEPTGHAIGYCVHKHSYKIIRKTEYRFNLVCWNFRELNTLSGETTVKTGYCLPAEKGPR